MAKMARRFFTVYVMYKARTIPLFTSPNVPPINVSHLRTLASQVHDLVSGTAPSKISSIFIQHREITLYNSTRKTKWRTEKQVPKRGDSQLFLQGIYLRRNTRIAISTLYSSLEEVRTKLAEVKPRLRTTYS